jgi:hypothetical protein
MRREGMMNLNLGEVIVQNDQGTLIGLILLTPRLPTGDTESMSILVVTKLA